jgi:hypothetical protein
MREVWKEWHWEIWDPEKEPLGTTAKFHRRISICTNCMNRLHDLMVTLPVNLYHNRSYPNVEFVLLNYNSQDKMDDWVKDYMMPHIQAGTLVYVHTTEPKYYDMSHSRNVSFKVASGDIVLNVDADNFTGSGFAEMVNLLAELQPAKAVFGAAKEGMHGRIGFYKREWLALGGYDEDLTGYGWDDYNLVFRAMAAGFRLMSWGHLAERFGERIPTPKQDCPRHMECKHMVLTQIVNERATMRKLDHGEFIANQGRPWGKATLIRNFHEVIEV